MKQLYYILQAIALSFTVALSLAGSLLLAGCSQQELNTPGSNDAGRLIFNTSIDGMPVAQAGGAQAVGMQADGAQSRAAGTDTDLQANGFYLAGYHTTGQMDSEVALTAYPNVFNKEASDNQDAVPLVTHTTSGSEGKFTLKTIKWPLSDETYLSFFGWSQSKTIPTTDITTATIGIIDQPKDHNDTGYPWIDIRNADAPADQTDVVGSRSLNHKNDAVISSVDLDFHHLLTKLTFKAKSSLQANITFTAMNIKYASGKVCKKTRYTFGNNVATIGTHTLGDEYHSGTAALDGTLPSVTGGNEVTLGSALLVPQALEAGDVSLELKYKVSPNSGNIEGIEQTQTLPLAAFTFEQGNNYVYTIDIRPTEIFVPSYPVITSWEIVPFTQLPLVTGAKDGKTLLLLDGYDKPYTHTDGKQYWLDRSGYNRHCEIVGYDAAMYNVTDHSYTFNNSDSRYLKVPLLPSVTALSVSVIAQQTSGANGSQSLINLVNGTSNMRPFFAHMGYNKGSTLIFDTGTSTGNEGRLQYDLKANSEFDKKIMFILQKKDNGVQDIWHNAVPTARTTTTTSKVALSKLSGQIGMLYAGKVSYVRIVSGIQTEPVILADYQECVKRFNIVSSHKKNPPAADQILTNGNVKWAIGNLVGIDGMNCVVGAPSDYGLYFRAGCLIGLTGGASGDGRGKSVNGSAFGIFCKPNAYTGATNAIGNLAYNCGAPPTSDNEGTGAGDPCRYYLGSPWRLPNNDELKALNAYAGSWTSYMDSPGGYCGTVSSGWNINNSVFFPAAGRRNRDLGIMENAGTEGAYITATHNPAGGSEIYTNLGISVSNRTPAVQADFWDCRRGYPVRCVSTQ